MSDDNTESPARARAREDVVANLAWGGAIVALAVAASLLRRVGYLDHETVMRMVIGANGLMIAWMGNRLPKAFVPNACARRVRRFGGWSMVISGLVYAGLYAFAPLSVAFPVGCGVVVGGVALTFAYCLAQRAKAKAA